MNKMHTNENNNFNKLMKIAKVSFQNQFSFSKIFVALIIMVVALLITIIQLSVRSIEETQVQRLSPIIAKFEPTIKTVLGISANSQIPINDETLIKIIDYIKNNNSAINIPIASISWESFTISKISFNTLSQVFSTAILYSLAWGIFSAIKDKNSVDRNRVMYINYNKNIILFFKLFTASLMFMFIVVSVDFIGILLVYFVGKGNVEFATIQQLIVQLIGIFIFYFFIQIFLRYFISRINSKKIKGLVMSFWLLSTAFLYIILSIILGIKIELNDVIKSNIYVFSLLPIVNIVVLPLVLYGEIPLWAITPISIQMVFAIGLIWRASASSIKNYLCS